MADDSDQKSLFGMKLACPDIKNLPLILNPTNECEVLAPGSVYQPLLLDQLTGTIESGPGKLNREEEAFVRDLLQFLYPDGNPPLSPQTPLIWDNKQVWLKRNIEKNPLSFRLRVDSSDWYYPDFIVWIIDTANRVQTFGFVDPKGLALGVFGGWQDHKVVCTQYVPHTLPKTINSFVSEGQTWEFRVRGVLVSTTKYETLRDQAKFRVHDEDGKLVRPTENQFEQARIVVQESGKTQYIERVLHLLAENNALDRVFAEAAFTASDVAAHVPGDDIAYDLNMRVADSQGSIAELVGSIVEDYSASTDSGGLGTYARSRRINELNQLAISGELGAADAAIKAMKNVSDPSKMLWEHRKKTPD